MGVTRYKLKYDGGQSANFSEKKTSRELVYYVYTSATDDATVVETQGPFVRGEVFHLNGVTDYGAVCNGISAKPINPGRWETTYTFETPDYAPSDDPNSIPPQEPWLRIPRIARGNQKRQRTLEKAYRVVNGVQRSSTEAVLMSNGRPPATAIQRNQEMLDFTVIRAERYWPRNICRQYTGALNNDSFDGHAPGTVLCDSITGEWLTAKIGDRFYPYWDVSYRFVWREDGWDDEMLQQGHVVKTAKPGGGYQYTAAVDPLGIPLGAAVLLDNEGAQLADGGTPVFWTWRWRPSRNFSVLQITIPP